jgi:hypothetical protein
VFEGHVKVAGVGVGAPAGGVGVGGTGVPCSTQMLWTKAPGGAGVATGVGLLDLPQLNNSAAARKPTAGSIHNQLCRKRIEGQLLL